MNKIVISIIIPVYNAENTIERCMRSVMQQTYPHLEIIVVNDGSTDGTLDIIEGIRDDRIRIINIKNGGVSNARNMGIEAATGDYVTFIDADDYLFDNMIYKDAIACIEKYPNIDFVRYNDNFHSMYSYGNKYIDVEKEKEKLYKTFLLRKHCLPNYSGLFIINKELIDRRDIRFPLGIKYLEDVIFVHDLIKYSSSAFFLDRRGYYVVETNSSATRKTNNDANNIRSLTEVNARLNHDISSSIANKMNAIHFSLLLERAVRSNIVADEAMAALFLRYKKTNPLDRIPVYKIMLKVGLAKARKWTKTIDGKIKENTVSIRTLNGYFNYGNRLQLYALKSMIERMGHGCVVYSSQKRSFKSYIKYHTPICLFYRKEKKLFDFTSNSISKSYSDRATKYTIVGSDQVWNPEYLKKRPFLLDVKNSIISSYAASIGMSELSEEQLEMFRGALVDYRKISVRERSAKQILQPIVKKEINVVLDPTLLLDAQDYMKIEKKPKNMKADDRYVLCYILGNHEYLSSIEKYANENGLRMIVFSDKKDSSYGIEEFLYLIHHAEVVCTDSFHACVFSVIFERPFVAFKRTGAANYMYTRLKNLIDVFELEDREYNGREITEKNINADYRRAEKILKKEKEKSINFLAQAIKDGDND